MSVFSSYAVDACRARIRERNDALNAVLHVLEDVGIDASAAEDAPLRGVPFVLKDTWDTAGIVTTGGSWRHRARVPETSSHAHRAFVNAGAVLLGKSNLCDLAFSAESDNHLRGPVRNPFDPSRTAGGSTGGGAAAVADGMAAFDWGTDFGGSIRAPAAFCGLVGLRLSHATWPVGAEHFPRIASFFWDFCGMGPLTRTVAGARAVVHAVRPALRSNADDVVMDDAQVVIYAPDRAHEGEWPSFVDDTKRLLDRAKIAHSVTRSLPTPTAVNDLFNKYLASHFGEFIKGDELPLRHGLPAVLLALLSGGRLDKRVHPNTAVLLAGTAGLSLRHRNRAVHTESLASLRRAVDAIWRPASGRGQLIVAPTCTSRAPRHGLSAFDIQLMTFCKLGNLLDSTALALPFGMYPPRASRLARLPRFRSNRFGSSPAMPRSLQILGPPGSEESVLDLAERLEPLAAHS